MGFLENPSQFQLGSWLAPNHPRKINLGARYVNSYEYLMAFSKKASLFPRIWAFKWFSQQYCVGKKMIGNPKWQGFVMGFSDKASKQPGQYQARKNDWYFNLFLGSKKNDKIHNHLNLFIDCDCHCSLLNLWPTSYQLDLRLLDNDLGSVMKAGEEFQWERINFVLEASCSCQI